MNLYTYVGNNPLIYSDPTGHWIEGSDDMLSKSDQYKIIELTNEFNAAKAKHDLAAMQIAHDRAYEIRLASGKYEVLYHTDYSTGKTTKYDGMGGGAIDALAWMDSPYVEYPLMILGLIDGAGEAMAAKEVAKEAPKALDLLTDLLKQAKPLGKKGNQLYTELDDGYKIIFRKDVGDNAHPIRPKYPNPVDHYNIEIQNSFGNIKFNMHLIVDEFGKVIDIIK